MAISKLQDAVGSSAGATSVAVVLATTTVNSVLVACIGHKATNVTSITDTLGNVWFKGNSSATSGPRISEIWYANNLVAGSCTVTININSSQSLAVNVSEYSGMLNFSPAVLNLANNLAITALVSGSVKAQGGLDNLFIATLNYNNSGIVASHDAGPAFTALTDATPSGVGLRSDYKIVSSSSAAQQMSWTADFATNGAAQIAMFGPPASLISVDHPEYYAANVI